MLATNGHSATLARATLRRTQNQDTNIVAAK